MSDNTFQSKEFKNNLERYEAAYDAGKPLYLDPDELTDIAEYYHLHGQLGKALDAIHLAIQMFPGSTQPLAFRARVAILLDNNAEEAIQYAEQIEDKSDLDYYYIMAEIMIAGGDDDKANCYLIEKSAEISNEDIDDYYLDVATLFADYDNLTMAKKWLALMHDTESDDYHELQGRIAMGQGNFTESERIFNKLIDHDPYHAPYWNQLASAQYLHNDVSSSIESSDFSLAINPDDADAIVNKANGLTLLGKYTEALNYYKRYKQLQPHSEIGDMGIATVFMGENKLEDALKHWKIAEKLCNSQSVNMIDILRNQCLVSATLGHFDEAFQCISKLESIAGTSHPDVHIIKGYIHLLNYQTEEANICFNKAINESSDQEKNRALFFIAYCYYDCGIMQKAHNIMRLISQSEQAEQFPDLWLYLSVTDYELGLQADFTHDIAKAIAKNPQEVRSEFHEYFPYHLTDDELLPFVYSHPITDKNNPLTPEK